MDTRLPSALLTAQHREIDAGIRGAAQSADPTAQLVAALKLLRLHFYLEEEILFLPLRAGGLVMPVSVMNMEHGEMWPMIIGLEAGCADGALAGRLHMATRKLLQHLAVHDPKEEEVVYAAADALVAQHPEVKLTESLTSARMPTTWAWVALPS